MKASERQSTFKARNSVVNAKANNVCLGVFPYQIEFTSKQEFTSLFYFEKDLQIIGTFTIKIQKNQQQTSLALRDINNLITFRTYKFHNLNYKWSQYRVLESGEEEFIESASINLKASLGQLVPLSGSGSSRSHESYIITSNIEKQLRVKLQKTGVAINFLLLICDDQNQLEAAVRDKFFKGLQSKKQDKVLSPKDNQMLSLQTQKDIKAIDQGVRQEVACQINSAEKHLSYSGNDKDATKEGYLLQLDALILDHSHHDQTLNDKAEHANTVQNEEDDLCFGIQKPKVPQKVSKQESEAVSNPNPQNEEKKTILRDYSLLRLESDQGRMLDPLDRRLESQQLQVIEEQPGLNLSIVRAEETANQEQSKQTTYLALKTESISPEIQSYVTFNRQNKTKLLIIVLIVVVTLLALFAFPRQLKLKTKARPRKVMRK